MTTADIHPGAEPVKPAAELRAAAAKLRETAEQATAGPWQVRGGNQVSSNVVTLDGSVVIDGGAHQSAKKAVVFGAALHADAAWIALAHPGLAKPLAAWLNDVADAVEGHDPDDGCECIQSESFHRAHDIARVINRSTS